MLRIRIAFSGLASRHCGFLVLLLLVGTAGSPVEAAALLGEAGLAKEAGVEEFRALIDPANDPRPIDSSAVGSALADYRRRVRKAAQDLPSLGSVAGVLLLSEWASLGLGIAPQVELAQVKEAVRQPNDEAFQRDVQKMMTMAGDNASDVQRAIVSEIKHEVRLLLLERLESRTRFYLNEGGNESRIAAANLISFIMTISRRQEIQSLEIPEIAPPASGKGSSASGPNLPQRLRALAGDVRKLLTAPNAQVQVAGIRALSDLGIPATELAAAFKPVFASPETDVATRRATADALAHVLELNSARGEGERPFPVLQIVEQILPVAVLGLDDNDPEVRGRCLNACRRAAMILDDMASDPRMPPERLAAFRPALRVVDEVLPKITAAARDQVPALRVAACRTLETFALAALRVRTPRKERLPVPSLDRPQEPELPKDEDKKNKGAWLPSHRSGRRLAAKRPSQWAATRPQPPSSLPSSPLPLPVVGDSSTPAVTLEQPVRLAPAPLPSAESRPSRLKKYAEFRTQNSEFRTGTVRPASFVSRQIGDLPAPTPVSDSWQGTVQAMITDLSDPDYRVRLGAVDVLETLGDQAEPAIPALVKRLEDSNKFVRWASTRTLGHFAKRRQDKNDAFFARYADRVVTGLVALLNDREDPSVRITAAYALEQYGATAQKAVPHLARVINRGDKDYIIAILHTIQGIGPVAAPALPNVAWVLSDRTQPTSVRVEAAQTLSRFGAAAKTQPRVMPVLRDVMLNDTDQDVRNAASTAILSIERPLK